jgi:hypothetical protein
MSTHRAPIRERDDLGDPPFAHDLWRLQMTALVAARLRRAARHPLAGHPLGRKRKDD